MGENISKATGVIPELLKPTRDYEYEIVCGAPGDVIYPKVFELDRSKLGTLKDQGSVGACVAEVMAQLAETVYNIEMSEGYAYGKFRNAASKSYGLSVSSALKWWKTLGIAPKSMFDMLVEMPEMKDIVNKIPNLDEYAKKYPISGYTSLGYADLDKRDVLIKDALMRQNNGEINGYGLLAAADEYFSESHCIMLTGWDDNKNSYIFKNSWGADYGDKGFSTIPKNEIDVVYLVLFDDISLPFTDVKETDWFYKDVKTMYFSGMINGKTDTSFCPFDGLNRAEACAIMNRMLKNIDERFSILNKVIDEKLNLIKRK